MLFKNILMLDDFMFRNSHFKENFATLLGSLGLKLYLKLKSNFKKSLYIFTLTYNSYLLRT